MFAQYNIEYEEGMEYIDLKDIELDDLLEVEQHGTSNIEDDVVEISDDLDDDELL